MLKNIKSALNKGPNAAPANKTKAVESADSMRRRKQKEQEAELQGYKPATKSLGSKKLASVVNRIKLITRNGRPKRRQSGSSFRGDLSDPLWSRLLGRPSGSTKQPLERRLMGGALPAGQERDHEDADEWSFHSACDYFDNDDQANQQDALVRLATDDKYILPEEQCDIPTFLQTKNCHRQLIDETRRLLRERHEQNPDSFYDHDYKLMMSDDWTVTRFLLRRRLDPRRAAKLMEECGKFRKQYLMSELQLWEFPREFHQAGGLFQYEPDRVGNQTLYMRVKMYRRVPEISDVFKAFILCVLERCDVANGGRGTAIIFDLSECGLQNVDLSFLYWLLNSFRNYCPKGVSYILVYNLPWFLSATCKLAMTWLSETNRRSLRFVSGDEIETFIARENLPDYLGGTCKRNYRKVPPGSLPAIEVCQKLDITPQQALKIKELFKEYLNEDDNDQDDGKSGRATGEAILDSGSIYGDVLDRGRHSVDSPSEASTMLLNDSTQGAAPATQTPLARNASSASLVPVVSLVSTASKFVVP